MTEIEKIKADIRALRIVVYGICVYIGFSLGRSYSNKNTYANQDKSLNHLLDNSADGRADEFPAFSDSIVALFQNGAVPQPD